MIISITERGVFKRCQRRWFLTSNNRMNLEPFKGIPALVLGKLVHETLEQFQRNPETPNQFLNLAAAEMDEISAAYTAQIGVEPNVSELAPLLDSVDLGSEMTANYIEYYKSPLPQGYRYIEAEQKIHLNIPHSLHTLNCTLDELVADFHDKIWVLERKTYGARPRSEILQTNDQFLGYIWALTKLFGAENTGGLLYDGLWKRGIVTQRGPNRKLADLFHRDIIIRNPHELAEFEQKLPIEAQEMNSKMTLDDCTINRRWEGCFDCPVESLCTAISRGEDWQYIIETEYRQRVHTLEEVEED